MLVAAASCVPCCLCLRYFDFLDQIILLCEVHICILLYDLKKKIKIYSIYEDIRKLLLGQVFSHWSEF